MQDKEHSGIVRENNLIIPGSQEKIVRVNLSLPIKPMVYGSAYEFFEQ